MKIFKRLLFYLYAGDYSLIYVLLLFFSVTIFGYEGIFKGTLAARDKLQLLSQYRDLENKLVEKDSMMVNTENVLQTNQAALDKLNTSIPSDLSGEDYLQEIAVALANDGFTIQNFNVLKVLDQTIQVHIELLGAANNLPKLYKSLSNLSRLTVLNSSDTQIGDRDTRTRLDLNIYYLNDGVTQAE